MNVAPPILALSAHELRAIHANTPQWYGAAVGPPIPFGNGSRATVTVDMIFVTTRDEAVEALWVHVRHACETQRLPFDEDEWSIMSLALYSAS